MALSLATFIKLDHKHPFSSSAIQEKNYHFRSYLAIFMAKVYWMEKQLEIVGGSTHYTFSDFPFTATNLGTDSGAITQFSGTLNGSIVWIKEKRNDNLLNGPTKEFFEDAFDF